MRRFAPSPRRRLTGALAAAIVGAAGCTDDPTAPLRPNSGSPSFQVEGDVTAPALVSSRVDPTEINTTEGPATATVIATVTDDLSGVAELSVDFISPDGGLGRGGNAVFIPAEREVTGSVSVQFPRFSRAGTWTVRICISDAVANRTCVHPAGELLVISTEDVTGPVLLSSTVDPPAINTTLGPATATLTASMTDDLSGVAELSVDFISPDGGLGRAGNAVFIPPAAGEVQGAVSVQFPRFSQAGTWTVRICMFDAVANRTCVHPAGELLVISEQDVTGPILVSSRVHPTEINTSRGPASATVTASMTDDVSGVAELSVDLISPDGGLGRPGNAVFVPAQREATGSVSIQLPQFSQAGTWTVRICMFDAVANRTCVHPAGQLVVHNTIDVTIDAVPLISTNIVFPRTRLPMLVAIPRTDTFDPSTVVVSSLRFGATGTEVGPLHSTLLDYDRDGDLDLLLLFPIVRSGIVCGTGLVKLTGHTSGGDSIEGTDAIKTAGCR